MSSIAFHSKSKTLRVSGRERAMMGVTVGDLFCVAMRLNSSSFGPHPIRPFVTNFYGNASSDDSDWVRSFAMNARSPCGSDSARIEIDGKSLDIWCLSLNTAMVMGSEVVKLMTRLHAQCEVHGWIAGDNRAWAAGVIRSGVADGLLRKDPYGYDGWEKVADMLDNSDKEPVVTSYSVCGSFPSPDVANFKRGKGADTDEYWEEWGKLSEDEQWDMGIAGLKKSGGGLEIKPMPEGFYFGKHDINAYQVMELAVNAANNKTASNPTA